MELSEMTDSAPQVTAEQLTSLGRLAVMQREAAALVEGKEKELKAAQAALRKIEERDIPDALAEAGLAAITTPDGWEIGTERKLYASIPKKNMVQAAEWLRSNNLGSLVRPVITVPMDNPDQMHDLTDELELLGVNNYSAEYKISTGSVKASIKELEEQGVDVPLSLFGAHWVTRAKIKSPNQ